jgi:hypothetical protein
MKQNDTNKIEILSPEIKFVRNNSRKLAKKWKKMELNVLWTKVLVKHRQNKTTFNMIVSIFTSMPTSLLSFNKSTCAFLHFSLDHLVSKPAS